MKVYLKNDAVGMTKDQYLRMVEQTGEEIDWDRCPADIEDFPSSVHTAMNIFNSCGNRMASDIGYMGKDFTNLPYYIEFYGVEDKQLFLEILTWLESRAIDRSHESMKREREKLKRKK